MAPVIYTKKICVFEIKSDSNIVRDKSVQDFPERLSYFADRYTESQLQNK